MKHQYYICAKTHLDNLGNQDQKKKNLFNSLKKKSHLY